MAPWLHIFMGEARGFMTRMFSHGIFILIFMNVFIPDVTAFTFNLTGGETTLTWMEDFDDNGNGWVLSNTAISDLSLEGRTDTDVGDENNCGDSQAGGFTGYLHINEDDGADEFPGPSLSWAEARNNLSTPLDLSGGPVSIYMALWSPLAHSPRQIIQFSEFGNPYNNVSFEWLSGTQAQIMVRCNHYGFCVPSNSCGNPQGPNPPDCPGGQDIIPCSPNQFRLTLNAAGDVSLQAYNLVGSEGTWVEMLNFNSSNIPQVMDHIWIGLSSNANGGERVEAIGGTQGGGLGPPDPPAVSAFAFELTDGDTALAWQEDFVDNSNGWSLSGANISNVFLFGRQTTEANSCGLPAPGSMYSYLHVDEDDGLNSFPGSEPDFARATINLETPIDLSGGPQSIYVALWSPTENSPRQLVSLQSQAAPGNNISFEWLSGSAAQVMVNCGNFGLCAPTNQCGNPPGPNPPDCPDGQSIDRCRDNQFRLTLDAAGNVSLQAYNLTSGEETWQQLLPPFVNANFPTVLETIRIGLKTDGTGGARVHAIGGTQGALPGSPAPSNAVTSFPLY